MDDIFVYFVSLPPGINEMVVPCADGFSVYIDVNLDKAHRINAYEHAMRHINNNDFKKENVQEIEAIAHKVAQPTVRLVKPATKDKYRKYEERDKALRRRLSPDKYWEVVIARLENQRLGADY